MTVLVYLAGITSNLDHPTPPFPLLGERAPNHLNIQQLHNVLVGLTASFNKTRSTRGTGILPFLRRGSFITP